MKIIGLTGSIGMGKSATAALFAAEGVPVHDADAQVHALYDRGGKAVPLIDAAFPGVVQDGKVDRAALSHRILDNPAALKQLEEIVHPLLGEARAAFFDQARKAGADLALIDVPLLFETGGERNVDVVVVVSAPAEIQRERVLARPGMTQQKFETILARQVSDAEKRRRADFVIETAGGEEDAHRQVKAVIAALRSGT